MTEPEEKRKIAWQRIVEIKGERNRLANEINILLPKAIKEMRKLGYGYDDISKTLGTGKITAIAFGSGKRTKPIIQRGRCRV